MIQKVRVNQGQMYFYQFFFFFWAFLDTTDQIAYKLRSMENLVMVVQNGSP